jgi:hypothetical protein
MNSVERQDDHDDEIRDQQRGIEGVPSIEMLKSLVGVVRLPIVAKAFGSEEKPKESRQCVSERGQVGAPSERSRTLSILRDTMLEEVGAWAMR